MAKKKKALPLSVQIDRLQKTIKDLNDQLKLGLGREEQLEYQISSQNQSQDQLSKIADQRTTELQEERQKSVALTRSNAELAISVRALQDTIIKAMKSRG